MSNVANSSSGGSTSKQPVSLPTQSTTVVPATPWWPTLVIAAVIALGLVSLGFALHGKALAEKTLTTLVMPIGATWLLCSGRIIQRLVTGPRAGMAPLVALWLMFMLFGTKPLPRIAMRMVGTTADTYNPSRDGPLDVVIVLGGGTSQGEWRPQASGVGDRLVMAAELFHSGHAKKLVTTGEVTEGVSDAVPDPSEQTQVIWSKLGIPGEAITKVGGRNTYEEMQEIKALWPQLQGQKIGLLTSALHLPRAMRLAKAQGLEMIPIAADIRTAVDDWGLLNFLPSAGNFGDLSSAQHELMARLVSR